MSHFTSETSRSVKMFLYNGTISSLSLWVGSALYKMWCENPHMLIITFITIFWALWKLFTLNITFMYWLVLKLSALLNSEFMDKQDHQYVSLIGKCVSFQYLMMLQRGSKINYSNHFAKHFYFNKKTFRSKKINLKCRNSTSLQLFSWFKGYKFLSVQCAVLCSVYSVMYSGKFLVFSVPCEEVSSVYSVQCAVGTISLV